MPGRRVLLAGATGLVGRECLARLAADPTVAVINAIVRRVPDEVPSTTGKIRYQRVDFDRLDQFPASFEVDQAVCALGTTLRQAGSREAFRRVDHDYALNVARLARAGGARHFLLVSALGADAASKVFYNRVKGELEADVQMLGYPSVTIIRPSILRGDRAEFRLAEEIAKRLGWVAPRRYRPVHAGDVASALAMAAGEDRPGLRVVESDEIPRGAGLRPPSSSSARP